MKFLKLLVKAAAVSLVMMLVFNLGPGILDSCAAVVPEESEPYTERTDYTDEANYTSYTETRIAALEAQVEALSLEKAQLTAQVEQYRAQQNETCMLVLRYEEVVLSGLIGDMIVVERAVQEVAVSRELYESCQVGDDITNLRLHRLLSCSGLSDTRVIVENKYIVS